MKTYKEQLNEVVNNSNLRPPTEAEADALRACTLEMFDKIAKLCKENKLILLMGGGSALGTVRHQGFIPWDDDMDLMMARPDYEKLLLLLKDGALGNNFEITSPNKKEDSPYTWLKIYQRDTQLIGIEGKYPSYPNGLSIDVFPIDGVPSNSIIRRIKGFFSNGLRLISNMAFDAELTINPVLAQLYNGDKGLKRMIKTRRLLGKIALLIMSHRRWVYLFDKFARNDDMSNYVGVPTGRKLYMGESHPSSVFFPPSKGKFEGRDVLLPAQPDVYLSRLYGDYMKIPSEENRESHFIIEVNIPERYYHY